MGAISVLHVLKQYYRTRRHMYKQQHDIGGMTLVLRGCSSVDSDDPGPLDCPGFVR
jgi:hypothetical protein